MPDTSGLAEFKQGVSLLRDDRPPEALKYFRRAAKLDQQNPIYMSYLGVSVPVSGTYPGRDGNDPLASSRRGSRLQALTRSNLPAQCLHSGSFPGRERKPYK